MKIFIGLVIGLIVFLLTFNGLEFLSNLMIDKVNLVLDSEFGRNIMAIKTILSFIGAVYLGRKVYRYHMTKGKQKNLKEQ